MGVAQFGKAAQHTAAESTGKITAGAIMGRAISDPAAAMTAMACAAAGKVSSFLTQAPLAAKAAVQKLSRVATMPFAGEETGPTSQQRPRRGPKPAGLAPG